MENPFADLIPQGSGGDSDGNPFADLVPKQDNGPTSWRRDVRRVITNIPGLGAYADEAAAAYRHYAKGEDYDQALASERARNEIANTEDTQKLFSTPLGDVYRSGVGKAAGAATALAFPELRVAEGAGVLGGAANAAATGAGYSALGGFGQGQGLEDRLGQAATDAGLGAAVGAPLGGALGAVGKLAGRRTPQGVAEWQASEPGQAVQAAEQLKTLGGDQRLPWALANADNNFLNSGLGALRTFPGASHVVHEAAQDFTTDLGANVNRVADIAAQQGTGVTRGAIDATAAKEAAGNAAAARIQQYMTADIGAENAADKAARDALLPQGVLTGQIKGQMPNTMSALNAQMARAEEAGTDVGKQLFGFAGELPTRPEGATLKGMSEYKSNIQANSNNSLIPNYTTLKDYSKSVGQASKEDVRQFVYQQGGQDALDAHDIFMANSRQRILDRKALGKMIGVDPSAPNAGAQIMGTFKRMASESTSANEQGLLLMKKAVGNDTWNDMVAAYTRGLGEVPSAANPGETTGWSAAKYITAYGKGLNENAKGILYGPKGTVKRDAMDNIYALSKKLEQARPFTNTSGTSQTGAWFELLLAAVEAGPLYAVSQIAGANGLAKLLTRDAGARATSRWATSIYNMSQGKGSDAAMKLTTMNLAKEIADQNGGNERDIEAMLQHPGTR